MLEGQNARLDSFRVNIGSRYILYVMNYGRAEEFSLRRLRLPRHNGSQPVRLLRKFLVLRTVVIGYGVIVRMSCQ